MSNPYYGSATKVVMMKNGKKGLILSYKPLVRKYLVYFEDTQDKVLLKENEFVTNTLKEHDYSDLYWHFKGMGIEDDVVYSRLEELGQPSGDEVIRAYVLEHGMEPDTHAEIIAMGESAVAAMRAGKFECV